MVNVAPTRLFLASDMPVARCNCYGQFRSAVASIDPDSEIFGAAINLAIEAILPAALVEADGDLIVACITVGGPCTHAQDMLKGKMVLRCLMWCHSGFALDSLCTALSSIDEAVATACLRDANA